MKIVPFILASAMAMTAEAGQIHIGMTESEVRQQYGRPIAVESLDSGTRLTFAQGVGRMIIPFHQMSYVTVDLNSAHRVKHYSIE